MLRGALGQRKLWTITCESLLQIVSSSLSPGEIDQLCRKHQITLPEARRGRVALYQVAHTQCHLDSPFSRQVQRALNRQHAVTIERLAATSPEAVRHTVEAILMAGSVELSGDIAGVIWAVASDPRPALRPIEQTLADTLHLLGHCLLLTHWRGDAHVVEPESRMSEAQWVALRHEVERLTTECQTLQAVGQHLEQQRDDLAQENGRLQNQLKELTHHAIARPQQAMPAGSLAVYQGNAARALRKLHSQLARLTAQVETKEREIRRLQSAVACRPPVIEAPVPDSLSPPTRYPQCRSLQGKTVALVGGLDKAASHYAHLIQELGGTVCCIMARRVTKSWLRSLSEPISCSARLTATVMVPSPRPKSSVGRCKSPVISCVDRASPICGPSSWRSSAPSKCL
jgi:hypothetical protein